LSFAESRMLFEKQELSFGKGIYFTEINIGNIWYQNTSFWNKICHSAERINKLEECMR